MKRKHIAQLLTLSLVAALALAGTASRAWGVSHMKQGLLPTGKDPDARGRVTLRVRGSNGRFGVSARRLAGDTTYEVIVDSVRIGTLTTGDGGSGKARFRTRPRGHDQLLGVDPRGKLVEVRDDDGDDVLETEMDVEEGEPGEIRCCTRDDDDDSSSDDDDGSGDDDDSSSEHETECEHETPAECAAHGGTDVGEGSCMPNPCETVPPQEEIRCCLPDPEEGGPDCEHETPAACAVEGGINIGPGPCEESACVPPPADAIRCCVPDHDDDDSEHHEDGESRDDEDSESSDDDDASSDESPECEQVTAAVCTALGGRDLGPGACEANLCVGSPGGAFLEESAGVP